MRNDEGPVRPKSKLLKPTLCGLTGLVIGFAIIHPATMLMNIHMIAPSHQGDTLSVAVGETLGMAFTTLGGWVWGAGYAVLAALIGFLIGALRIREVELRATNAQLVHEKHRSEELLSNILPDKVVNELKEFGKSEPHAFANVTVLFADIVGFSGIAAKIPPKELIQELNELFTGFDHIMEAQDCERLKTIGDAYLAVCGMPEEDPQHAEKIVRAGLQMIEFLRERNRDSHTQWEVRIGIHTGSVVGGVVGVTKYIYDVFGDTVNCAARLEHHSTPMRVNISQATHDMVEGVFPCTSRGDIETKERRKLAMFYVDVPTE